ncbi:MAG: septum formation initiator family protein [Flavobacteriales bacterium]|nr:septum formation initiator family protein [Flavobacteriales bacterium]
MRPTFNWKSDSLLILQNRYFITALFGLIWVSFISDIDLFYLAKSQKELNQIHQEAQHFELEITRVERQLLELSSDPALLEKFARERYFMKRPNEDIFRIIPANNPG